MNEELDNEEVVEQDVPETSEEETAEEEVVVNASQDNEEDIEKLVEERANRLLEEKISDRLAKDRSIRERDLQKKLSKYQRLENIMKAGLGVENIDDAISKSTEFYENQGINIPQESQYGEREEKILAKADAEEIIDLGKSEMEAEANRIAGIPESQRTLRDKTMFDIICKRLIDVNAVEELKSKGYDTDILNDSKFNEFREQFTVSTPISTVYDLYKQVNGQKAKQPNSPGSAKSNNSDNEIKEYYTPEEVRQFTEEDLDNPKLMQAVERSMQLWGKSK